MLFSRKNWLMVFLMGNSGENLELKRLNTERPKLNFVELREFASVGWMTRVGEWFEQMKQLVQNLVQA